MKTLSGRRLFFATGADLAPGLRSVEQRESLQFVLEEMRDAAAFTAIVESPREYDLTEER